MLGKRIQLLRTERGWTQAELAKKLNITKKAVKNWESGSSKPSVDHAIRLADIFGISTDSLFERERRDPIYLDFLPPDEQRRARILIQDYMKMVMNELKRRNEP